MGVHPKAEENSHVAASSSIWTRAITKKVIFFFPMGWHCPVEAGFLVPVGWHCPEEAGFLVPMGLLLSFPPYFFL